MMPYDSPEFRRPPMVSLPLTRAPLILILLLLAAACQTPPSPVSTTLPAAPSPAPVSIPSTAPRYVVDAKASEIRLLVYRDGPLARFGHNHAVVGRVRGEIRAGETARGSGF